MAPMSMITKYWYEVEHVYLQRVKPTFLSALGAANTQQRKEPSQTLKMHPVFSIGRSFRLESKQINDRSIDRRIRPLLFKTAGILLFLHARE
jgi:hypothetical protein